jgi:two-component system sensor kinase
MTNITGLQSSRAPKTTNWRPAGRDFHKLRLVITILVGAAGVLISVLLQLVLAHRQYQLAEAKFLFDAQQRLEAVEAALTHEITAVTALQAFFAASDLVERAEFATFSQELRRTYPSLNALGCVRRVREAGRAGFEEKLRGEKVARPTLLDRDAEGRLVIADQRQEYWPVDYYEAKTTTDSLVGLDLGKVDEYRTLLEHAQRDERLVVAPAVPLEADAPGQLVLCAVVPVSEAKLPSYAGMPQGPPPPLGHLIGIFRLDAALRAAIGPLEPAGVDTYLLAETAPGQRRLLAVHYSRLRAEPHPQRFALPSVEAAPLRACETFELGDTRFTVCCLPMSDCLAAQRSWLPWAAMLVGLAITALVIGYLLLLVRQTVRSDALARQYAAELQSISEAALDAVVMMDPRGNVAHWNPAAERIFGHRAAEIIGRNVHEILAPPQDRERARHGLRQFFQTGSGPLVGKVVELVAVRKDGSTFPIEIAVSAVRLRDGWGAVAIIRDVTRRKQIEESLRREQQLLRRMLDLQERDRKLVAFEIHDGLAQLIAGAKMQLDAFLRLRDTDPDEAALLPQAVNHTLGEALAEARRLMAGLRSQVLDEAGIIPAIQHLVEEQRKRTGLQIAFAHRVSFDRLAPPLETAVFRIVQEALANACRHSQSDAIEVEITQEDGAVCIEVRDRGIGFDPNQIEEGRFGILGIRERARLLGGHASIQTAPGQGARVRVELPLLEKPSADPEILEP